VQEVDIAKVMHRRVEGGYEKEAGLSAMSDERCQLNRSPVRGSFSTLPCYLTECVLSDIAENAVSFFYRQLVYRQILLDPIEVRLEAIQ
jgi:hypothetical protein